MIEIKNALKQAIQQLSANNPDSKLDAEVLLAYVLMKTRTYLYTHPEECLSSVQWITFQRLINKRRKGYPVAYLTGTKEFWSLPLKVSEDTLIPRPETELLVELTLSMLADISPAQILELGTGSGAIALAIAKERPDWTITACDCSEAALQIAEENAASLGLTNIQFYCSDWYSNLTYPQFFDAIVSNPPYICQNDPHLRQGDLRFEPQSALVSGETGLTALQHIIQYGIARLKPMGLLLVEHGYDQKFSVGSMLNEYGYMEIQCWQDWQGNDRISGGKRIIVDEIIDF